MVIGGAGSDAGTARSPRAGAGTCEAGSPARAASPADGADRTRAARDGCSCYAEYLEVTERLGARESGGCCPTVRVAQMLAGKWRLTVLFELSLHPSMRFSELKRSIPGITGAMLTTALRELQGYGVVTRTQFNEVPPRVEYALSESGRALYPIFYEMARWGATYLPRE